MALTEKKIAIVDEYLLRRAKDKTAAVRAIDPTIKNPAAYAWKVFREKEVREYLISRRAEILKDSAIEITDVVKGVSERLKESIGLQKTRKLVHTKETGWEYSPEDFIPDSADAKNYWGILKDILGPEIATVIASAEAREDRKLDQRETEITNKVKTDKERLALEKSKSGNLGDKEAQIFFTGADDLED